jgi:hypothetical protein
LKKSVTCTSLPRRALEIQRPPRISRSDLAGFAFELAPDLVRSHDERDVLLALADRDPGDARFAAMRSLRVRRLVAVDADHLPAALGELVGGGAAHGAQADDRDVVHHACEYSGSPARAVGFEDRAGLRFGHDDSWSAGPVGDVGHRRAGRALHEVRDLAARVEHEGAAQARVRDDEAVLDVHRHAVRAARAEEGAESADLRCVPSASSGPRHTWFARVTATKSTLPADRARCRWGWECRRSASRAARPCAAIHPPARIVQPVWPWSVK